MIQSHSPEHIQQVLKEILVRPEFNSPPYESWLRQLYSSIFGWLDSITKWSQANPSASIVLTILLTMVLLGLLAHIFYTAISELVSYRRPGSQTTERWSFLSSLKTLEGLADTWDDALRLARDALRNGDSYRAIWIAHRLLLEWLDRKGALKFAKWKTNSDYLRECESDQAEYQTLDAITAAYDHVVYGHRLVRTEVIEGFLVRLENLGENRA